MGQIIDGAFYSDYDGQDIDRRLAIAGGVSNPNLLDSAWFTVNQRGTASGKFSSANKYYFDRWLVYFVGTGASYNLANGLELDNTGVNNDVYLYQFFENELDTTKTYTISVLYSDGHIEHASNSLAASFATIYYDGLRLTLTASSLRIQIQPNAHTTIRAVKLESGSVSTLGNDVAPNYTTELLKCQRYFVRINGSQYKSYGFAFAESTTSANLYVTLPVEMRQLPSITTSGSFALYDGANKTVSSFAAALSSGDKRVGAITCTSANLTAKQMYALITTSSTSYIDLSAEII